MAKEVKVNCASVAIFAILLLTQNLGCSEAKRVLSSNRKSNSGRTPSSGHVTKSYPTQSSAGNSHSDLAKLSYSGYNSAPNRPASAAGSGATNTQPIGWNVPKSQGSPASGTNVHTPITATNTQGVQSSYPGATYNSPGAIPAGATYHSPGSVPAGATYYSPGSVPAGATYHSPGALPAGATYHSPGALPAGATYHSPGSYPVGGNPYSSPGHMPANGGYYPAGGSQYPSAGVPAGATYVAPGAALPPGAVLYSSPPQQTSSGLGFGSGLAAGAIGGAILGHVLTPTHTRVESAPAASAGQPGSADDKIIIINNGPPGSVTTTNAAGATVITTGVVGENATQPMPAPAPAAAPADPAIPNVPLAPIGDNNAAQPTPAPGAAPAGSAAAAAPQPAPEQPPPGGIICVPVRVNETDAADSSKMTEVEKIACYPAPPPPPPAPVNGAEMNGTAPVMPPASEGSAPLAPMSPVTAASQQLQANPTQAPLLPDNASVKTSGAGAWLNYAACNSMTTVLLPLFVAFFGLH
ncbi:uncharacterized protein Rv2082 [Bactrocera dorsalis]|uniref:Uncharacterized protein Rv2082 n=1 Tax=Bactrocera dorsalis TaxID=27457 RepID=A0ABM3JMS9_BACDO|nr:uncharacterized protein Rv2082 [Bactrocera dorsalis]